MRPVRFTSARRLAPAGAVVLFAVLFLGLPGASEASCCANGTVSTSCCNVFGCNCDGPCTNFGCSAPPAVQDGACGVVPTYDTCTPDGTTCVYCNPGYFGCQNCSACCSTSGGEPQKAIKTAPAPAPSTFLPTEAGSPQERFKAIDTNGDGKITFEEAASWFKNTARGAKMDDQELRSALSALDQNQSGAIEPEELDRSLAKAPGGN